MRRALFASLLGLAACAQAQTASAPLSDEQKRPQRIVSLDMCADQYVLKFAEQDQILALSPEARLDISYMRDAAKGIRQIRPDAENVLALKPDLIVRAYGGGANAEAMYESLGIPVLSVGWASDMDGILGVVEEMASGLGAADEGKALTEDIRSRLDAIPTTQSDKNVFYLTTSGFTTGPGTLIDDFFKTAGMQNFETEQGWRTVDLEKLATKSPDLIALAYHERLANSPDIWSATRHPVTDRLLADTEIVTLDGAVISCSGWYVIDAIEALSEAAKS